MYEHLARIAEEIGARIHSECPDKQEDCSETTGEEIAEAIRAKDLQWTTTPPAVEGWYWVSHPDVENGKCRIIEWAKTLTIREGCKFLGPLPEPEPPQG